MFCLLFWFFPPFVLAPVNQKGSDTGNRTPGICVTGRDVPNYTMSEAS